MYAEQTFQPIERTGSILCQSRITDPPVASGRRSEVSSRWTQPIGEREVLEWQLKLPNDWFHDNHWCLISQCHACGGVAKPPPFAIEIVNHDMLVRVRSDNVSSGVVYKERAKFGDWLKFKLIVIWSPGDDGELKLSMDGADIVNVTGPNYYTDCADVGPYFKAGIYVSPHSLVGYRSIEVRV